MLQRLRYNPPTLEGVTQHQPLGAELQSRTEAARHRLHVLLVCVGMGRYLSTPEP